MLLLLRSANKSGHKETQPRNILFYLTSLQSITTPNITFTGIGN